MSLRRLLDRDVSIVPRVVTGTDARGNDVITDGAPTSTRAGRDLEVAAEDVDASDLQTRRFVYFFPPDVELSGFDVIVDGAERFEVVGSPEVIVRRRTGRAHHIEATASRVGP